MKGDCHHPELGNCVRFADTVSDFEAGGTLH